MSKPLVCFMIMTVMIQMMIVMIIIITFPNYFLLRLLIDRQNCHRNLLAWKGVVSSSIRYIIGLAIAVTNVYKRFLAHSKNELTQWRGVRRLSVRLSVCKLLRKSLLLPGKWPDRHQTFTRWSPGKPASRVCSGSRSKVTWYAHFLGFLEWATPSLTVWSIVLFLRRYRFEFTLHIKKF